MTEILACFFFVSSCVGWCVAWQLSRQRDRLQNLLGHYIREIATANKVIPALTERILEMQDEINQDGEAWKHGNN